jgi:hypothetical protein
MKKSGYLSCLIFLLFYVQFIHAQKPSIKDYVGTWRWASGNRDTFLIILMPNLKMPLTDGIATNVIGYHTYIEKGQLVESNVKEIGGKEDRIFSIAGSLFGNKLNIWFRDFTRDGSFTGSFQILKDMPGKALWDVPLMSEKYVFYGLGVREYPPGRTVPNNIVLEKIN